MIILPAIDLYGGQAVRLYQGDYRRMTVYDTDPLNTVRRFEQAGAGWLHLVDLEGAKSGGRENFSVIRHIAAHTDLRIELGGGIRSLESIEQYLALGVSRVILGTAAVTGEGFAARAAAAYGERIAVGVDIKQGRVAMRGWTEQSGYTYREFCVRMREAGVQTLICTDVSRDGALQGSNLSLYRELCAAFPLNIIASGGVSSLAEVQALAELGLYGAIIGKAYYTGAIDLKQAIESGKGAEA